MAIVSRVWPKSFGLLAEFETPAQVFIACENIRAAGYMLWDVYSPFHIPGLEEATGLKPSPVPWFVLISGLAGAAGGLLLQWWVSVVAYPHVVSGKPLFSWPALIPIMFECGILGGALGALIGFLVLARLPEPHHALFYSQGFERATDDRFFISIESRDPQFDMQKTSRLLQDCGAVAVETIRERQ